MFFSSLLCFDETKTANSRITDAEIYRNPAKIKGGKSSFSKPNLIIGQDEDHKTVTKNA
jgi:hypothetical protein